MKVGYILLVLIMSASLALAQESPSLPASSLAGGVSVVGNQGWQPFHNPSKLVQSEDVTATLVYENRFGLQELSTKGVSISIPTRWLNIGMATSSYGFNVYKETLTGVSLARSFNDKFSMGVGVNYYSAYLSNSIGRKGVLLAQVGIYAKLTPALNIGFNAFNPVAHKLRFQGVEKAIESLFSLGASLQFAEEFVLLLQLDKGGESSLVWRAGFEYYPLKEFRLRLGAYGMDFLPTLGCGTQWKGLLLDLNFARHPVLGISSVGMLRYCF